MIHRFRVIILVILLGGMWMLTPSAQADLVVSSTPPVVDSSDIANLNPSTSGFSLWSDRPVVGQTFNSGVSGGELLAITFQLSVGSKAPINGWKDYQLRVGTIDSVNKTINPLVVSVDRYSPDANNFDYFTIALDTPLSLSPDTLYGFDIGVEGSQVGWQSGIPQIQTTGDLFAGGQRYSGSKPNQIDNTTGLPNSISFDGGRDLVFHLDIASVTAIPEASPLVLWSVLGSSMLSLMWLRKKRAHKPGPA